MRVLIVEDEAPLAEALAQGLRRQGYAVDVAPDGEAGLLAASVHPYDLLLLDLNLPGCDGLEVCRRVRRDSPDLLILMVTARTRPLERVQGLDQGADDYLTKPFNFSELCARIRALLRRRQPARPPALAQGRLHLDVAARVATVAGRPVELTAKEFAVLEYLLRQAGCVVSTEELLEHVWDREVDSFTNTARVHVATLRRKLAAAGADGYIETVVGAGYRLQAPEGAGDDSAA